MTAAWKEKVVHYIDPEIMGAFCSEYLPAPRLAVEEGDVTCKNCILKMGD